MNDKEYASNKVNNRNNIGYTSDEMKNKYRFQKRWQEKNGYIVKSYRLNEETIEKLLKYSKDNNMSQASILRNAFQRYKENNKLNFFLNAIDFAGEKKFNVKKGFKITKKIADEIETACKEYGYAYGCFVTMILDDYMANMNQNEKNTK